MEEHVCHLTHALVGLDGWDLHVVNVSCDVLAAEHCWEFGWFYIKFVYLYYVYSTVLLMYILCHLCSILLTSLCEWWFVYWTFYM